MRDDGVFVREVAGIGRVPGVMLSRTLPRRVLSHTGRTVLLSVVNGTILPRKYASPRESPYILQGRLFSTPTPHINHSDLPMPRYHALADATMNSLLERLEDLLDDTSNKSFEVDYHSGVLTLNLGEDGTYVINKQPPNKQIWLSSPVSGPKRYDYVPSTDDWRYSRNGQEMGTLLEQELTRTLGREIRLELDHVSESVE